MSSASVDLPPGGTGGSGPTSDVNLAEVGGVPFNLGQALSAASLPVVIASDQSPIPISGTSTVTGNVGLLGLNSFATSQYQVGTSPVQISIPPNTSSISVKAITTSGNNVLVGPDNTLNNLIDGTGNGYFLFNGDSIQIDLTPTATVWAIGTAANQVICVLFAGGT